jgi:F420-dependent oxidoreductase-like protein
MYIGLQIPHFRPSTPQTMRDWFKSVAQAADENGFYSLWVMDHFFQLGSWFGEPETDMVEGYTTLGYFAGLTQKVKLGLMVGGVIYRHPAIVVKIISTLDVLSGGRAYFGIGASWYEFECQSLGIPFPPVQERFELLEEQLQIAKHMWSGNTGPFESKHYKMLQPMNNPQPLTKPHPPILIGGMGEKKTLRLVAQYADACNMFSQKDLELLRHKLEVLKGHCADIGRPYDEIEKTLHDTINLEEMSPSDVIERWKVFAELGFTHVICCLKHDVTAEIVARIGREIIPEAAEI